MAFSDKIAQADGIVVALNCGLCGAPAGVNHRCAKRMLRSAAVCYVTCLADPQSTDPTDMFLIKLEQGGEEYATTRAVIERDYEYL